MRNDEAVLNKSGGLCAGTAHDVGDPLFVYKLGLAEEKLHPGDRAMLDRLGVMYTYTETDHDVGNPVYVYKLGMAGQHDVGDPDCGSKLSMARQTLLLLLLVLSLLIAFLLLLLSLILMFLLKQHKRFI